MPKPTVFISATTGDLRTIRDSVKQAILTLRCVPIEQTNFPPDYRTIEGMLRKKIQGCHAVIHIAGLRYGAEPKQDGSVRERRSYTQMEYDIARELKKPVYTFVCGKDFPYDDAPPEDAELQALQERHREKLLGGNRHFEQIAAKEDLDRKVREIDYKSHLRWTTRMLTVLGISLLLAALASGYALLHQFRQLVPVESADRLFDANDYAGAFHAYARLSDREPSNLQLHRLIEKCAKSGHLEKAFLDHYLALVTKEPSNPVFLNYLGNAYLMIDANDKDQKGRQCYEAALRLDPELTLPLANLGILSFRAGKPDEAERHFARYLSAQPDDAQAWVNLGLLFVGRVQANPSDTQAIDACTNALANAIRLEPGSFAAYRTLGRLFLTLDRTNECLHAYQTSLNLNPNQPDVSELLNDRFPGARSVDSPAAEMVTRGVD